MSEENDNVKELALKTKVQKDFPEFTDAVDSAPLKDLEEKMLAYAKYREETEMAKKKDEALEKAKNNVKELQAPYNETLNALKAKTAYLGLLIQERKDSAE
jgi:FtsZ-binding cell division protein ZapB